MREDRRMNLKNFGPNVRKHLEDGRITARSLGRTVNISDSSISKILHGSSIPTFGNVVKICQCLGVSVDSMLAPIAPSKETRAQRDIRIVKSEWVGLDKASLIFKVLERDILDRRGIKSEWAAIESGVLEEIESYWTEIINEVIEGEK